MTDEITELLKELDKVERPSLKRSLTGIGGFGGIITIDGSLTDANFRDVLSDTKELEYHLDNILSSIRDYKGYLSKTRANPPPT